MKLERIDEDTPRQAEEHPQRHPAPRRGVISMRVIVAAVAVGLVIVAVVGAGAVAEHNARDALMREMQGRLVLEARHLALLSSRALLDEFPELTLHPLVKDMHTGRADLAFAHVADHKNIVQGHEDVTRLGEPLVLPSSLSPMESLVSLYGSEQLLADDRLLVATIPIRHAKGNVMGTAIVGFERNQAEQIFLTARQKLLVFIVPILGAAILLTYIVMSVLLRPVAALRNGMEQIALGNLSSRVNVRTRTELGVLATSINQMASELEVAREQMREKERLDVEMKLAREIQRSLLPTRSIVAGDFVITGSQTSAAEVGGDYYDILDFGNGRIGVVIADVAGKGLGGCLVTSMLAVLVRSLAPRFQSPKELLLAVEQGLAGSVRKGTFVTMFYGVLDTRAGKLKYASAAHNPSLYFRARDGGVERHKTKGLPLHAYESKLEATLIDFTVALDPGDVLLQTTDGINEAKDSADNQLGFDQIEKIFVGASPRGAHAVVAELEQALDRWEPAHLASDDRTILVIERLQPMPDEPAVLAGEGHPFDVSQCWRERRRSANYIALPARLDALELIGSWLGQCSAVGSELAILEQVEHGLVELCANIVEHGHAADRGARVDIWWLPDDAPDSAGSIGQLLVRDRGLPFDLQARVAQASGAPTPEGRGLGLHIIGTAFDKIRSRPDTPAGNLNVLHVTRQRQLQRPKEKPCLKSSP